MAGRVIKDVSNRAARRVSHLFVRRGHRSPVSCMTSLKVVVLVGNALRGAVEQMGFWFEVSVLPEADRDDVPRLTLAVHCGHQDHLVSVLPLRRQSPDPLRDLCRSPGC